MPWPSYEWHAFDDFFFLNLCYCNTPQPGGFAETIAFGWPGVFLASHLFSGTNYFFIYYPTRMRRTSEKRSEGKDEKKETYCIQKKKHTYQNADNNWKACSLRTHGCCGGDVDPIIGCVKNGNEGKTGPV